MQPDDRQDDTRKAWIKRNTVQAPPPSPELIDQLRQLLPPLTAEQVAELRRDQNDVEAGGSLAA